MIDEFCQKISKIDQTRHTSFLFDGKPGKQVSSLINFQISSCPDQGSIKWFTVEQSKLIKFYQFFAFWQLIIDQLISTILDYITWKVYCYSEHCSL